MNAKCYYCHQGYDSSDIDDVDGFGRCDNCKAKLRDIIIKTDNILAARRRSNPLDLGPSFAERFDTIEVPNKWGGFDKKYVPKQ